MRQSSFLQVDLGNLNQNYTVIKHTHPHHEVIFMVKANAYGHGLIEVVNYAHCELGINNFGVACLGEAYEIRRQLPELKIELIVFSDFLPLSEKNKEKVLNFRIIPVLSHIDLLKKFLEDKDLRQVPLYLKFNTGMNRLGLEFSDTNKVMELLIEKGRYQVDHLMTHFYDSYLGKNHMEVQYKKFKSIKSDFQDRGISIISTSVSNSGAIENNLSDEETHIRPGLMMYGVSSKNVIPKKEETKSRLKLLSSLVTRVVNTRIIKKGDIVGYGGTPLVSDGFLVHLAIGYGDGFLNSYQGLQIIIEGYKGNVVGRVSMDLTAVLLPIEAQKEITIGNSVSIWSDTQSFINIVKKMKVIPYEVLTNISVRVPRRYLLK